MSGLMTPDWQPVRGINAKDPTAKYHADTANIYRVVHPTGAICALGHPWATVTGTLVFRPRLNPIERAPGGVATNPLSKAVGS